ncbi:4'-phosphopantetheinyl transferase B [Penicillium argentinense]|uniref:4'-phosphopantetheinyl transferase B n=1 Tax=Penicillium argentinense TaxID=1131581 RepID=A0A9W9EZ45_9EURO|nr:4'-phosphopantetheinyl transferase B [Penicillium argentinense]KAJ5090549.1 4'-phosphopantetheinyl transferase B [Penicillium argentinense]
MKPIPFPYALNIGTDIVHLPRITRLLTQRANYLSRFTQRILSDTEQRDFHRRFKGVLHPTSPTTLTSDPSKKDTSNSPRTPPVTPEMTRWLAGRFAAKEAARKAAPKGAASIGWKDVFVSVQRDERGVDGVSTVTSGAGTGPGEGGHTAGDGTSRRPEIVYRGKEGEPDRVGKLSISHDGDYVVATVLAAG